MNRSSKWQNHKHHSPSNPTTSNYICYMKHSFPDGLLKDAKCPRAHTWQDSPTPSRLVILGVFLCDRRAGCRKTLAIWEKRVLSSERDQ